MVKYLFILLLFPLCINAQRTSLKSGLQKSIAPSMIPVTDSNNEQVYRDKPYIDSLLQVGKLDTAYINANDSLIIKNVYGDSVCYYGGVTSWGSITGTLSSQTDLQTSLNLKSNIASPTFTGSVVIPTPFTLGATSVTSTGTQLNYLSSSSGTTGTTSTNIVFSTSPTLVTPLPGTPASGNLANCTFPTLDQNTTGSAATLTTPRTIAGTSFNGSSNISITHANLSSLSADDHTQYSILAGRTGGQTLKGGTGTTDDLILQSTSGVGATGALIQMKVGNNGGTTAMTILNTGAIGLSTITSPVSAYLELPGSQLNSSFKVGAFECQSYAVNNGWLADNIYYATGLGFIARANGFGCMSYYYNGAYQIRVAASSLSAGATFTPKIPLVINRNSSASIGGDVTAGVGHVGSYMMVDSIGKVGIGTSVADKKLEVNLGTADALRLTYNDNNGSATNYMDVTISSVGSPTFNATGTSPKFTFSDPVIMGATVELKAYTVGTLPTGVEGAMAYVTDATAPTYLGTLTGGGAVKCPVFYNGIAWVSH